MESRQDNSQTSTRKPTDNNDALTLTLEHCTANIYPPKVNQNDQFSITFANQDILCYSNCVDDNLSVEANISSFEFWRSLFTIKYVNGDSNKIYIMHCESCMYLSIDQHITTQKNLIIPLCLTRQLNKYCEFQLSSANAQTAKTIQEKFNVSYDMPIYIKNRQTQMFLQISKQNRMPHLSFQQSNQIHLKLYKKGQIYNEDLWITNEFSNYLQNGDLVLLLNKEKTSYVCLELKNQIFMKNSELKYLVNKKYLEPQNYTLTQKSIAEINNTNIVYCLWNIENQGQFNGSGNSLVYNRDTVTFKHPIANVYLYKSWSSNTFPLNIFELGKEGDQGINTQNCGFHIKNMNTYCFSNKKITNNALPNQPLYLHNSVILEHRFQLNLIKVKSESISYLKLFNQCLVQFSQALLDFISQREFSFSNRKVLQLPQDRAIIKNNNVINGSLSQQAYRPEFLQILTIDYQRLKVLIKAYHKLYSILISNETVDNFYTSSFAIKTTLLILETVGNYIKSMNDLHSRSKPILQPLIISCYEFLINTLGKEHIAMKAYVLTCIKKLAKIDGYSSISVAYYLSRIWNPNNVIQLLLQLCDLVHEEDLEFLYACIADIIQHCIEWKQQPRKIKQIFSSLGITVLYTKQKGVTLQGKNFGPFSVLDFRQADLKTLYLLKIAVFSEAYFNHNNIETILENEQILLGLLHQQQNFNKQSRRTQGKTPAQKFKSLVFVQQEEARPYYRAALIQFINFYLFNLCASTISTLKNRKFILLNSSKIENQQCHTESQKLNVESCSGQMIEHAPNSEQSLIMMLKKSSSLSLKNKVDDNQNIQKDCSRNVKLNSNIYWLINYEDPPFPIIEIAKHLENLIQNLKFWDSTTLLHYQNRKCRTLYNSMKDKSSQQVQKQEATPATKSNKSPKNQNGKIVNLIQSNQQKMDQDHLCFMIESFNSLINIFDIIVSVGYLSFKYLHTIQQYVLQLCIFLIQSRHAKNVKQNIQTGEFRYKYQNTFQELQNFYKQKNQKGGLSIKQIVIQQKIKQLFLSINDIFATILMLKKRLVVHPGIEIIEHFQLFHSKQFLHHYLTIYHHICKQKQFTFDKQNSSKCLKKDEKIDPPVIRKLLNFYYSNYKQQKDQIIIITLPDSGWRKLKGKPGFTSTSQIIVDSQNCKGYQNQNQQQPSDYLQQSERIEQNDPNFSFLAQSRNLQKNYISSFKHCQNIAYKIQLFTQIRQNLGKSLAAERNAEAHRMNTLVKSILDINADLNEFKNSQHPEIDKCIIRAYELPQKLTEAIFCTKQLQDQLLLQSVNFLCENPPILSKFVDLHQKIFYSLSVAKIFIKSLQHHLRKTIQIVSIEGQIANQLKDVIALITNVITACKSQLKQCQFILVVGVICQIFPNRTLSQKIYHILLQMYKESQNTYKGESTKNSFKKFILDGNFKPQINGNKQIGSYEKKLKLNAGNLLYAFKTLQTFKDFLNQYQNSQQKLNENSIQFIDKLNRHISLVFRLCENSEQVNHHFTENIIKYDSLQAIAFDAEIPLKFKIPFLIYFRNDFKSIYDSIVMADYFQWMAEILREYANYISQLPEYIYQNDTKIQSYHSNQSIKQIRQKQHKVSLVFDNGQQKQQFFGSTSALSLANTKAPSNQYYYWQLLLSRPFMHRQEGMLVLLQEMLLNIKALPLKNEQNEQQNLSRSIIQINDCLKILLQKFERKAQFFNNDKQGNENLECSIAINFMRKVKKNIVLMQQKVTPFVTNLNSQVFINQAIATNIINILLENGLLERFINIFYYNEIKNTTFDPLNLDKRNKQLSQVSDISNESFKHSRSSKMSNHRSSKQSFEMTVLSVFKKTQNLISLKELLPHDQDGLKSGQPLVPFAQRLMKRKYSHQKLQLNLNKYGHKLDKSYLMHQIVQMVQKICEFVFKPNLAPKLIQLFISFFQQNGTSKILGQKILNIIQLKRVIYVKDNKNVLYNINFQQQGFIKLRQNARIKEDIHKVEVNINWTSESLLLIIKEFLLHDEIGIAIRLLKSLSPQVSKSHSSNEMSKIYSFSITQKNYIFVLQGLSQILKYISSKSVSNFSSLTKYLSMIKYLLIIFMPIKKFNADGNQIKFQKKIQNFLAQYVNKILFIVNKNYKQKCQISEQRSQQKKVNRNIKKKKETVISYFNRKCDNTQFSNYKLPQKKKQLKKQKKKLDRSEENLDYIPQLQAEFYCMIELYAISEARMTNLQKELYQLVNNKLLKMVYGMTLQSSLKLIFKSLLLKCSTNLDIVLPDIISNNRKLQQFIQDKIKQVSSVKHLMSSNMAISQNLSLISIFYDYLCWLLCNHYFILALDKNTKQIICQKIHRQNDLIAPQIHIQLWEQICRLEEKITKLLIQFASRDNLIANQKGLFSKIYLSQIHKNGVSSDDERRFCLLHRILSQSINIFNFKMLIDCKQIEAIKNKKNGSKNEYKKQQIPVWTLNKFIESRSAVCFQNKVNNRKKINLYTKLYESITHVVLPIASANNSELLFSFLNQKISSQFIFHRQAQENAVDRDFFLYKKFGSELNKFIINQVKKVDESKTLVAGQKRQAIDKQNIQEKEAIISKICDYIIYKTSLPSLGLVYLGHRMVANIFLLVSLLLIALGHVMLFGVYDLEDEDGLKQSNQNKMITILRYLLYANFCCLLCLFSNRVVTYWRFTNLHLYVVQSTKNPMGTSITPNTFNPSFWKVLQQLLSTHKLILLLMIVILFFSILSMADIRILPILFTVIIFVSEATPQKIVNLLRIFLMAGWVPFVLMCAVLWMYYFLHSYVNILDSSPFEQNLLLDMFVTKFIRSISGKAGQVHPNWQINIIINSFEFVLFLILAAALLGHLRWNMQFGSINSVSKIEQCIICGCQNTHHIKYNHNIPILIDLHINLKVRDSQSITFLEHFIKKNMLSK